MNWDQVAENWPAFADSITSYWPRTDPTELAAIDGDRARLEAHVAASHDLTAAEAEEAVDVWLSGAAPIDALVSEHRDDQNIAESGRHIPPGEDVYSEDADFGDDRVAEHPVGRHD